MALHRPAPPRLGEQFAMVQICNRYVLARCHNITPAEQQLWFSLITLGSVPVLVLSGTTSRHGAVSQHSTRTGANLTRKNVVVFLVIRLKGHTEKEQMAQNPT
jgi:hypothetical protein